MKKQKLKTVEQRKRSNYNLNEIFFKLCDILNQTKFSKNLVYYGYKRKQMVNIFCTTIKNRCVLTNNSRITYSNLKLTKTKLSYSLTNKRFSGFYLALW
jgi:hypothetical protein